MHYIGLQKNGDELLASVVEMRKGAPYVIAMRSFSNKEFVNPFYILQSFSDLEPLFVTSLDPEEVIQKELLLPTKNRRTVRSTLPFQLENFLPFNVSEAIACPISLETEGEKNRIKVSVTTGKKLRRHIRSWKKIGLLPDIVTSMPQAIFRIAKFLYPDELNLLVLNLGLKNVDFFALKEGEIVMTYTLSNRSLLKKNFERIKHFFLEKKAIGPETPLLVFGQPFKEEEEIFENCLSIENSQWKIYGPSLGMALDAAFRDGRSLQFRQEGYSSKKIIRQRKKSLSFYFIGVAMLTALIAGGGILAIKKKESRLYEELKTTTSIEGKNLTFALDKWKREQAKVRAPFPFYPSVPKVSDVLLWLSTHPILSEHEEDIEIKRVYYTLSQYPKLGSTTVQFRANLDIEFTTASPKTARLFHDALMKGDPMIDSKSPVNWNQGQHSYRAQFSLTPNYRGEL